jgi:hypothetical protein
VANPGCTEASSKESLFDRFAHTYSFNEGLTLREYGTLTTAQQATFVSNCARQMAPGYPEGVAILATFSGPASEGVNEALDDLAVSLDSTKGSRLDEVVAGSDVKRRFIRYVVAARLSAPRDDTWVDSVLGSHEPVLLKGLLSRDFRSFETRRSGAFGYIVAFNERIGEDCSSLYDERISDDARLQGEGTDAGKEAGERDAQILIALSPSHCQTGVLGTIMTGMRAYLAAPKERSVPAARPSARPAARPR